jgi:hypothetical protein
LIIGKNLTLICLKFLYNDDMDISQTPSSGRIYITLCNAGKSGLVKAVTVPNPAVVCQKKEI